MATLTTSYQELSRKLLGNSGYGNVYLIVYGRVSSSGYDIENNRTKVYAKSTIKTEGGYWFSNSGTTKSISCTGLGNQSDSANGRYEVGETTLYEISGWVTHNNDGTKSVTISSNFTSQPWGWNQTANGNANLPTIPRASSVTATNADIGSATTININRASSSFKHTLEYSFGSLTGTIVSDLAEVSYGWTVPTSFYDEIPDSKTGTCTITCKTYSGSTLIGTKTTTFIATANEELSKPTVSASVIDTNQDTIALTGSNHTLVRYKSNAQVTWSSSAKNSSEITSNKINTDIVTQSPYTINNFDKDNINFTATDSRGYSNSKLLVPQTDYNFVNYLLPTMSLSAFRTHPTTGEISVEFSGNYFNDTFGQVLNSLEIKWDYKKHNNDEWITGGTLVENTDYVINDNTYHSGNSSYQNPIVLDDIFDYRYAYDIRITYTDVLGEYSIIASVSKGIPIVNWNDDTFNVNGEITKNGIPLESGDAIPINSIFEYDGNTVPSGYEEVSEMSGSNSNGSWTKFADGTMICRKTLSGVVSITTAWGNLYEGHFSLGDAPQNFIDDTYHISLTPQDGSGVMVEQAGVGKTINSFGTATLVRPNSTTANPKLDLIAIGRWK